MRSKPASVISTDRHALVSLGRGFSAPLQRYATRSLSNDDIMDCVAEDADWVRQKVATQSVASVEDRIQVPVTQPFENSPVLLRIYYDDQLQNLSLDTSGGQNNLTISDPKEGQVVTFEIENVSDAVMGVVLAINGVNTLYGGDATEPRSSAKWILQPKRKYGVRGIYSKDHKSVTPIRGVSDETSRAIVREGRMSLDLAGLIGFFVFRQAVTDDGTQQDGSLVTNQGEQATQAQTGERPSKADQDSLATKTSKSDSDDLVSLSDVTDINIQDDDTELTGFNLGLMRSLTFQPRENANRAGSWSKLRSKLLEPAKKSSTTRGLMIADGPRKQADLKTGSLGNNEMIVGAIIRYYSLAVPSRAR
ncbi:MAG: hypothetical protein HKN47_29095 [Pirellulaceae bacterium]|nr:hypothetical protein [Pirellulaceae bacterium]